jgi:hypothetical protein
MSEDEPYGFLLCPLFYLKSDLQQIQISEEFSIEKPSDLNLSDISKSLIKILTQNYPNILPEWVIIVPYSKIDLQREGVPDFRKVNDFFTNLFTAFRLCHSGSIVPIFFMFVYSPISDESATIKYLNYLCDEISPRYIGNEYNLTKEDFPNITNLFEEISKFRISRQDLDVAIRRFHLSYQNNRDDDKLIDQMIAFESLYLGDDKELGYKLALRTSFLLGKQRAKIFKDMKKAYEIRGKIVHGQKQVDWAKLVVTVNTTQEYLRQSIRKFLLLLSKGMSLKQIQDKLDENILTNGRTIAHIE